MTRGDNAIKPFVSVPERTVPIGPSLEQHPRTLSVFVDKVRSILSWQTLSRKRNYASDKCQSVALIVQVRCYHARGAALHEVVDFPRQG
jgi:hypothetical protein